MSDQHILNNDIPIPGIGFGTWQIRFNGHAKKAVEVALGAGYRLIDTARIYGNEKGVGRAIRESGIAREEIFVTTKLWNFDQGYDKTIRAFESSLNNLGLEYIDLYLIHWPVPDKRLESWRAMEGIYKSGRMRSIGVSNFTVSHLEELLQHAEVTPAVNQIEFHPFIYNDQKKLLDYCQQQGIIIEAYSPLAHGERLHDPVITAIASGHQKTNAQVLLRWCIQHGTVPLPKSSHLERIAENLAVFDFELTDGDMDKLNGLSDGSRTCWDPTFLA